MADRNAPGSAPRWGRSTRGLWHVVTGHLVGPWWMATCGRTIHPTLFHDGYVAPAVECQRCQERVNQ